MSLFYITSDSKVSAVKIVISGGSLNLPGLYLSFGPGNVLSGLSLKLEGSSPSRTLLLLPSLGSLESADFYGISPVSIYFKASAAFSLANFTNVSVSLFPWKSIGLDLSAPKNFKVGNPLIPYGDPASLSVVISTAPKFTYPSN